MMADQRPHGASWDDRALAVRDHGSSGTLDGLVPRFEDAVERRLRGTPELAEAARQGGVAQRLFRCHGP